MSVVTVTSKFFHCIIGYDKSFIALETDSDGTFLIRPSKHGGTETPFTLSLRYNKRIFHIQIRKRMDDRYALGSQKAGEDVRDALILNLRLQNFKSSTLFFSCNIYFSHSCHLLLWCNTIRKNQCIFTLQIHSPVPPALHAGRRISYRNR